MAKTVDLVEDATNLAHEAMQWLRKSLREMKPGNAVEFALVTEKAIELVQAVHVARGGVSGRTEHVSTDLAEMLGGFGFEADKKEVH